MSSSSSVELLFNDKKFNSISSRSNSKDNSLPQFINKSTKLFAQTPIPRSDSANNAASFTSNKKQTVAPRRSISVSGGQTTAAVAAVVAAATFGSNNLLDKNFDKINKKKSGSCLSVAFDCPRVKPSTTSENQRKVNFYDFNNRK